VLQDPFEQFERWMADAAALPGIAEPNAMSLATVGPSGHPSNRMVLLKGYDASGFVFYTNYDSRKGQELDASQHAALCFHWQALDRQVRVEGPVARVGEEESTRYHHSRPRSSQIGAWCSAQSSVISGREVRT
jgi:pyridoxamine-phosphate oxidase